jgi:hypothetical protein
VILLTALAWTCIVVARRMRGKASAADAFFPLALLTIGHCENLIFFVQVFFVVPVVILTCMLLVIVTQSWKRHLGLTVFLGAGVALMPASGGVGLVEIPFLAAWCAYAARTRWRDSDPGGRRDAWILSTAVALAIAGAALYFVGWAPLTQARTHASSAADILRTMTEVWSLTLGGGGARVGWMLGSAFAAMTVMTLVALAGATRRFPDTRLRSTGIAACLASTAALAIAVGLGRAAIGPGAGLPPRYALLMTSAAIAVFFAAIVARGQAIRRAVPTVLMLAACALIVPNISVAVEYGRMRAAIADSVQEQINRGMPPDEIAELYARRMLPGGKQFEEGLMMLRTLHVGPYAHAPALREAVATTSEQRVDVNIVGTHDAIVVGDLVRGTGPDPYLVLALPSTAMVLAVRVRYTLRIDHPGAAQLQTYWMLSGHLQFAEQHSSVVAATPDSSVHDATFWIHDTIDHVRVDPDVGRCTFRLLGLTLIEER